MILFDEIDRLLLDRDSARYETQADMFQFMTPSMLVKLNDLREEKRSIFIIATNYAERIDNAIKRPGRIDLQIPLLPPDERQRKELIRKFEGEYRKEQALKKPDGAAQSTQNVLEFNEDQVALLAHLMPLYIAAELDQVVRSALDLIDGGRDFRDAIDITLKQQRPSISLESYESRFYLDKNRGLRPDTRRTPWQEFALLAYICAEVEYEIGQELSWVRDVLNLPIMEELGPDVLAVLQRYRQIGQPKA
ncbi:hypothetical protein A5705_19970 [Mycobacterium sp. E787]|nr:hypothetical protein A5705_19970 [Mycobacterium sp. E787]